MEPFAESLRQSVRGSVHTDVVHRGIYATDASHYQITPRAVVVPADAADVARTIQVCAEHGVPVTSRGGGTSLSGQTFGPGVVIDLSRHLNRILDVDPDAMTARVEAGIVRDQLNDHVRQYGLHFAPDPATTSRATIGGMIGNNSSGTRSMVYGKTVDHVHAVRATLADGSVAELDEAAWAKRAELGGRSGEIHRGIERITGEHRDLIRQRFPRVMRRVAGYNLDEFVDGAGYTGPIGPRAEHNAGPRRPNLASLVAGSEGTLAAVTEATVRLTPLPKATALCVVHFDDAIASLTAVPAINELAPAAVELLDRSVIAEAIVNPSTKHMATFFEGVPDAVLICEFFGDDGSEAADRARGFADAMKRARIGRSHPVVTDPARQADVWATRRLGLGLISNVPGPVKGQAFVEDACVPVEVLGEYINRLAGLCRSLDVDYSMYAHASVGVIHFRPAIDLHRDDHRQKMATIAEQAFEWVVGYGGVFSGEHGDGIVRGRFIRKQFGEELYKVFRRVKGLFDPTNLMNPGKIIDPPEINDPDYLRYGSRYRLAEVPASYRYAGQGGFAAAVEQCNGVGACRKVNSGVMCPSYMATRDEQHSTRGRANALRLAMTGQLGLDAAESLASDGVHEALELCLSCKACKSECPNAVDMAKLKSDALQIRHDRHGATFADWFAGLTPAMARRAAGPMAVVANRVSGFGAWRWFLGRWGGIDRRRPLPPIATDPVRIDRPRADGDADNTVVLFLDTYARYFEPHVGRAAIRLLESAGFDVLVPDAGCCQRPALSRGLVRYARRRARPMLESLDAYARQGLPIVTLEPSCASAIVDDLPDLFGDPRMTARLRDSVRPIEQLLVERGVPLATSSSDCSLHGHCHHKATFGNGALIELFDRIDDASLDVIDAGCCGMAGSFGYRHYDLSETIAGERLLPAARAAIENGRAILANGVSCRHQLHDLLGVAAKHPVEVLSVRG